MKGKICVNPRYLYLRHPRSITCGKKIKKMEFIWFTLYNIFIVPLIYAGFYVGQFFNRKIKDGLIGRRNQWKLISESLSNISPNTKRIMFHCTSVGEWEQAVPIIESIKTINPAIYIVVTFFSPSGYKFVKSHPNVDLKIYMPLDSYFAAKRLFKLIKPSLWIISKFDIWANHIFAAHALQIPIINTAATLSPNSGRDKGIAGSFNKHVYPKFDYIFPISDDDQSRFIKLFPYPDRMTVAGDTRFDQVYNKGQKARNADPVKIFDDEGGLIFIGGSIWPADEKHILPALIKMMQKYPQLKAILVPHELHESHIADIEKTMQDGGFESERYTDISANGVTGKRVAIMNTIGMLARLYKQTHFAYIGGSFSSGVHNVMEPAVFGQPVFFGPINMNSFEAGELKKIGCAFEINNSAEAEAIMEKLITDESFRNESGKKAKDLIENNIGATQKIMNIITKRYDFLS
jgi:3-deoxy-D-manno-octulosonic-acid transferase